MSADTHVEDRVVLEFLERYASDRDRGTTGSLADYQAMFPGFEDAVRAEFEALSQANGKAAKVKALGPFRLLDVLGHGGQGTVHLAEDTRHHRQVALKVLPQTLTKHTANDSTRMTRELEVLSRLDHPNICVVYEAGEIDGYPYLAMRYVPGQSLAAHIANERPKAGADAPSTSSSSAASKSWVKRSVEWARKIALALDAAHGAKVVHRDIKPANVLIHENGEPVILDFGLARAEDTATPTLTRSGDLIGTPQYMSPERLRGTHQDDPRGDVWSLGVLLYEAITGVRPFDGPTVEVVVRRIENDEPVDPRRYDRTIPRDLSVVLQTALAKPLGRRYQSARAFADDLGRVLANQPTAARPLSGFERASRWVIRNPMATALLLLLVVLLAGTAIALREFSDLADDRRASLLRSQDYLSRSAFEEARLLRSAAVNGRSWTMLERLRESIDARAALLDGGQRPERAPSLDDIRNVALEAMLVPDARLVADLEYDTKSIGSISNNGRFIAMRTVRAGVDGLTVLDVRLHDATTGAMLAKSTHADLLDGSEGIAVADDGRRVALAGPDEASIDLWDLRSGEHLRRFELPEALRVEGRTMRHMRQWNLSFSRDGRYLGASVCPRPGSALALPSPRGFALWDVASGERLVGEVRGEHSFMWQTFSPDSRYWLVPEATNRLRVYGLGDEVRVAARFRTSLSIRRACVRPGPTIRVVAAIGADDAKTNTLVQLSPRRRRPDWSLHLDARVELGYGTQLELIDDAGVLFVDERRRVHHVGFDGHTHFRIDRSHRGPLDFARWRPDLGRVITHGRGRSTRHWEPKPTNGIRTTHLVPNDGNPGGILSIAPSGERMAYSGIRNPDTVWTWNRSQPLESRKRWYFEPVTNVFEVIWSADASRFARVASNRVDVWTFANDGHQTLAAPKGSRFLHGVFMPDGRFRAVRQTGDRFAFVFVPDGESRDLDALPPARWLDTNPTGEHLVVLPGGKRAGEVCRWNAATGKAEPFTVGGRTDAVNARNVKISPDGKWIAALQDDRHWRLRVWRFDRDDAGDPVIDEPMAGNPAWHAWSFSPDGRWLAVNAEGGDVKLIDLASGRAVLHWHASTERLRYLRFLADGRLATWPNREPCSIWDLDRLRAELDELGLAWPRNDAASR